MEPKDVTQNLEIGLSGLVKVEPEEAAAAEQALDRRAVEVNLPGAVIVNHETHRGPRAILARRNTP
jgi:CHASE1-domain containing sensor protein